MKTLIRRNFISWAQKGYEVRAIALCDTGGWFEEALNCMRDGDMGEMREDGTYPRIWVADSVWEDGNDYDLRPASPAEVDLYLKYCSTQFEGSTEYIVRGAESYALFEVTE